MLRGARTPVVPVDEVVQLDNLRLGRVSRRGGLDPGLVHVEMRDLRDEAGQNL